MSRQEVKLTPYSSVKEYCVNRRSSIRFSEYEHNTKKYMFYAKNQFSSDSYEQKIKLYAYEIVKETPYFYFLINGQRVSKQYNHPRLSPTPEAAVERAMERAQRYLNILIERARNVDDFIQRANTGNRQEDTQELRHFEAFIKSLGPAHENLSPEAYAEKHNVELEIPF